MKTGANYRKAVRLILQYRKLAAGFLVCSIAQSASKAGILWLIRNFLQRILDPQTIPSHWLLYGAAGTILLVWLLSSLSEYGWKMFQQKLMRAIELGTMMKVIRHLLTLSVRFFDRTSHGDLLVASRVDIVATRDLVGSVCTLAVSLFSVASLIFVGFQLSPYLAFCGFVVLPAITFPVILLGKKIREIAARRRGVGYKLFDLLVQVFRGIRIIKVYQGEEAEAASCEQLGNAYYKEILRAAQARAAAGMVLGTLAGLGIVVAVVLGGFRVIQGQLEWPTLLAMLMVLVSLQDPMSQGIHALASTKELLPSLERLETLLNTRSEIQEAPCAKALPNPPHRICFEDVSFAYDSKPILSNIAVDITAGETIGIVGPSGAGKTTLLNLLARFYDPTTGRIAFDGIDVRAIRISDLMKQISIVTQDPFLFDSTVRENIRYGNPEAGEDQVVRAAKAAQVHEEILDFPEGYDTLLGVGGMKVSGGQQQRINVARALLRNAPILLLDEATSSLDSIAEAKVQAAIDVLMKGRTCFVIAHRLSTLRAADRIIVLNAGCVEAVGSHDQLLLNSPTYRGLWETQSRMERSTETWNADLVSAGRLV